MHHNHTFPRTEGINAACNYLKRNIQERRTKHSRAEQFLNFAIGFFCGALLILSAFHFAGYIP